jgi:hypothetical protein
MRQFRGNHTERFIIPKIKLETSSAYLFLFKNGNEEWIPKKWITSINKGKNTLHIKEYWAMEMKISGFELKK